MSQPQQTGAASARTGAEGAGSAERGQRRRVVGRVTSTRMQSTITVLVERTFKHAKYGKFMRRNKAYHAHDPAGTAQVGDLVELMACRPISRLKRWLLVRVVESARERGDEIGAIEQAEAEALGSAPAARADAPPGGGS
jgi:small subunit ribosomal protein S17